MQTMLESYMIELFKKANLSAIHAKRVTVEPKDIQMSRRMSQMTDAEVM